MASSVLTSGDHISSFSSSSSRSQTTDNSVARSAPVAIVNITDEQANIQEAVKLYQAALKGDWKTAKSIFDDKDSTWITKKLTAKENTALHIAAAAKHISFVENLVKLYSSKKIDIAITNKYGRTALTYAAISGVVRIAEAILENDHQKHRNPVDDALLKYEPLLSAVTYKRRQMASYLFSPTTCAVLQTKQQFDLLVATIDSDYYDIALEIVSKKPELVMETVEGSGDIALHLLARKPHAIGSSNQLGFWKKFINSHFNRIYNTARMQTLAHQVVGHLWGYIVKNITSLKLVEEDKRILSSILNVAAKVGNVEFLIILIHSYPDLIWISDGDNKSIFHVAVENRQEKVFSLIHEIEGVKDLIANGYNENNDCNILHLAGMLASPYHLNKVSGEALQMQYEFRWFKEVEKIVTPSHCKMKIKNVHGDGRTPGDQHLQKDDDGLTPRELFKKKHEDLRKKGEGWMRKTANSCMLVATLITTMVFAASYTVREAGNVDKDAYILIFQKNVGFKVFIISNAAAMVMSTTSILIFLSILTSRYAEKDFLIWLPIKLLVGLVTLLVSIAFMMVAFSATFFIAYDKTKMKILPWTIAAVTILPIVHFIAFHCILVADILQSTCCPKVTLRKYKKRLF